MLYLQISLFIAKALDKEDNALDSANAFSKDN
jgi:hypothetical protein